MGIKDGRVSAIGESLSSGDADEVVDAAGKLVLPGAVDAHFHLGIYRDISQDTRSETLSSLAGGVTSIISYFRTGSHYLGKSGPYAEIFPEVLEATSGTLAGGYGYHLAPRCGSGRRDRSLASKTRNSFTIQFTRSHLSGASAPPAAT